MSLDDQIHRLIDCNCPLAGCSGNCKHRWIDISICGTGQVQYAVAGTLFNHFYDMHKGSTPGLYKSTDYGVTWTQPTGPHSGPQARPAPACQRLARRRSPPPYPLPLGCKRSPHGSPQRPPVPQSEGVYGGWRNTYSVGCSADGQTVLVLEFRQNGYDTNPYHGSGMPNHEVLWKSTDGAATFTDANSALHSVGMHALSMSNSGAAFVVGLGDNNHLLYKSSDLFATYEVKPARRHIPASSPISRLSHLIHSPLSSPTDCGDWRRHSHFCKCQEV